MSLFDHIGSQYLSAKKLGDKVLRGKVVDINEEQIRGNDGSVELKHVLYLEGEPKGLVLNATNIDSLVELAGESDPDAVVRKGVEVELRAEMVQFGNKQVPGIRLHPASKYDPVANPEGGETPF